MTTFMIVSRENLLLVNSYILCVFSNERAIENASGKRVEAVAFDSLEKAHSNVSRISNLSETNALIFT